MVSPERQDSHAAVVGRPLRRRLGRSHHPRTVADRRPPPPGPRPRSGPGAPCVLDAGAAGPHHPPMVASIEVDGLRRSYGEVEAVCGLSFRVEPGSIFGLLGPNGAGKTTTLRVLATLIAPSAGSARVAGHDVVADPLAVRRALGYLTGDTGLYARLTPVELLRFFGELHALPRAALAARIDALVDSLDIGAFRDRPCGKLSTGQQQRVSIARALVHDPPVLVLDEPTSGLDILSAQYILTLLRGERDRGKAILFSTHVMAEAELLCDRIGLLHRGRLLALGTLDDLLAATGGRSLTDAFLRAIAADEAAGPPP